MSRFCGARVCGWLLAGITSVLYAAAPAAPVPARAAHELDAAIAAMGGTKVLRGIERVHLEARVYRRLLAQSERPEGPWVPEFSRVDQRADFVDGGVQTTTTDDNWRPPYEVAVADGVAIRIVAPGTAQAQRTPGRRRAARAAAVRLALGPERMLLTARAAADLHAEPLEYLQDVPQQVVAFTWHNADVRLYLNAYTSLPTAVEITRPHPYDVFWNVWGDVTTRIYYSFWMLKAGGLRYPKQWDVWRNGQPVQTWLLDKLELNPAPVPKLSVSARERKAFERRGTIDATPLGGSARTLAPGIVMLPGAWNTTVVAQDDGIVILEAPISSGYSAAVLKAAQRRYPRLPVKAVVTTSDAWPHVGGLREYVARGIPLYALDLNVPLIEKILTAPHTMRPDDLARTPRAPQFHVVSARTAIGSGDNRIVLYPVHGEAGERMMVAYFPRRRLLYTSDLVQPTSGGRLAFPEYLDEVAKLVAREGLRVERVFGMHTPQALPWNAVVQAIAAASADKQPRPRRSDR